MRVYYNVQDRAQGGVDGSTGQDQDNSGEILLYRACKDLSCPSRSTLQMYSTGFNAPGQSPMCLMDLIP